ncbi:MAG: SIR2 family protein, partial [Proteobacteria bacterium]|nr:SIR2 family protein [Pseudomonadota bacterium]
DRLFENCAPDVTTWQYPNLPDLTKDTEFEGLVYLHGRVNEQYTGCDEEFILSTAEFGRAYLAEGSATRFFKQIIAEYTVVFVGYGAEDPPVRYLLEAFNKEKPTPKDKNKIYAFQSGTPEEANKKWANRGVTVIPYDEADKHKALWNTFSEWVVRTKTTEAWQDGIMKMAVQGPEGLLPFDREKVLQMVATEAGAKRFGADDIPPPATWLNVFNFELNYRDKCEAGQENMVSLIGTQTPSAGKLPHRFYTLGNWIASVSDQPAAVWWAVRQTGVHLRVQDKIKEALGRKTDCPPYIKLAWQYIFDSWSPKPDDRDIYQPNWCSFVSDVKKLGWDATMVRRSEELTKPWMVAKPNFT